MLTNRHIVDQLADVRFQRMALQDREAALRARINRAMEDRTELEGDEFIAFRTETRIPGTIDPKKLRAVGLNPDRFRKLGSPHGASVPSRVRSDRNDKHVRWPRSARF